MKKPRIGIIGSGNVAFSLGYALFAAGFDITEVCSRNVAEGKNLKTSFSDLSSAKGNADVYFLCVQDSSIEEVSKQLAFHDKIIAHTSGSTSLTVLSKLFTDCGVFYPLQSFSKGKKNEWSEIPVCIESSSAKAEKILTLIAKKLSKHIYTVGSEERKKLHLAAVFANNFANACFSISDDLLKEASLPFSILRPLILNTALKVQASAPASVQTGPAIRNDLKIIKQHKADLKNHPELKQLYSLLTAYIQQKKQ